MTLARRRPKVVQVYVVEAKHRMIPYSRITKVPISTKENLNYQCRDCGGHFNSVEWERHSKKCTYSGLPAPAMKIYEHKPPKHASDIAIAMMGIALLVLIFLIGLLFVGCAGGEVTVDNPYSNNPSVSFKWVGEQQSNPSVGRPPVSGGNTNATAHPIGSDTEGYSSLALAWWEAMKRGQFRRAREIAWDLARVAGNRLRMSHRSERGLSSGVPSKHDRVTQNSNDAFADLDSILED